MASAPSTAALLFLQGLDLHPRRFLLHNPPYGPSASSPTASTNPKGLSASRPCTASSGFDTNVVMVLSVLLCALICSLGLNTLIRCAIRCSSFATAGPNLSHHQQGQNPAAARVANTGIKTKALKTFPTVVHSPDLKLPGLNTECAICLSEFLSGDRVRLLPKCNHGFHVRCIDLWLSSHSSCPTCRNCLIETCEKIVGCSEPSSSRPAAVEARLPEGAVVINMAPLQREGLVRS